MTDAQFSCRPRADQFGNYASPHDEGYDDGWEAGHHPSHGDPDMDVSAPVFASML